MKRRVFLTSITGSYLLSGCLSRNEKTRIGRVTISNFTTSGVSFTVKVLEHESTVYEKVHRIEGDDATSDVVVPSVTITEELPTTPGTYVIEYGFAGESLETFDFSNHVNTDCGQVHIDIREERSVELFYSAGCDTLKK
jgi:hypothetical protein